MNLGIEIELMELLLLQLFAFVMFDRFEVETSAPRRILKWMIICLITIYVYYWFDHWATLVLVLATVPSSIYHVIWCKKTVSIH